MKFLLQCTGVVQATAKMTMYNPCTAKRGYICDIATDTRAGGCSLVGGKGKRGGTAQVFISNYQMGERMESKSIACSINNKPMHQHGQASSELGAMSVCSARQSIGAALHVAPLVACRVAKLVSV